MSEDTARSEDLLVDVRGLKVHFPIKAGVVFDRTVGHVYAVDGVDLVIRPGEVLVAPMTDPDWEPVLKQAAAVVADEGGRTCHAATSRVSSASPAWWAPGPPRGRWSTDRS